MGQSEVVRRVEDFAPGGEGDGWDGNGGGGLELG